MLPHALPCHRVLPLVIVRRLGLPRDPPQHRHSLSNADSWVDWFRCASRESERVGDGFKITPICPNLPTVLEVTAHVQTGTAVSDTGVRHSLCHPMPGGEVWHSWASTFVSRARCHEGLQGEQESATTVYSCLRGFLGLDRST